MLEFNSKVKAGYYTVSCYLYLIRYHITQVSLTHQMNNFQPGPIKRDLVSQSITHDQNKRDEHMTKKDIVVRRISEGKDRCLQKV